MTTKEFIARFAQSDLANLVDEIKLDRLKKRLAEEGLIARYSDDITPTEAAFFVLCGLRLPTLYKGEDPERGANWWIREFHLALTSKTIHPLTGELKDEKRSLAALADIIADPGEVVEVHIDQTDLSVHIFRKSGLVEEIVSGLHPGNKFHHTALSLAIIRRGGLQLLHEWTK